MGERDAFVIMIKDNWWREFLNLHNKGKQVQAYVQGGWAPPKETSILFFYVTKPIAEISGYAEFIERKVGSAEEMWREHGSESVLGTAEKFLEFVSGKQQVSFIRFKNLHETPKPIPVSNVKTLLGVKQLPRKGFYINKEMVDTLFALMK